jgi:hypothetical protein
MRFIKSFVFKLVLGLIILVNLASALFVLAPSAQVSAASYSDISAIPSIPSELPDGSTNQTTGYTYSFADAGASILVKGSGIAAGKEVKFQYADGKAKDTSGAEFKFKYYRPPRLASAPGHDIYRSLFFNSSGLGFIEADNLNRGQSAPTFCNIDNGWHVRIVSFLPNEGQGVTIESIMQAYGGDNPPSFSELISSRSIISTPQSPYNVILCSRTSPDGLDEFYNGDGTSTFGLAAYKIRVTGAGSGGGGGSVNETWYDYRGRALRKADVDNRFKFVNPKTIVDTGLTLGGGEEVVYQLKDGRDEGFPDNDEFWHDGVGLYKPAKWKDGTITPLEKSETGNKCLGFFIVDANGRDDGEVYGDIYGVPTGAVNDRCRFDKNSELSSQFWGFYKDKNPDDIVKTPGLIDGYKVTNNFKAINGRQRALWFSRLYWNAPDDIRAYGTNVQLKLQDQEEENRVLGAITNPPNISRDAQVWTTSQCVSENPIDYPFVLVDYSNQYTNLQDNAVDSPNALARIYVPNEDTQASDWAHRYDGDLTNCLFGSKVKYNWIGEGNNDNNTYIGNLAKSVGNNEDSIDQAEPPPPGGGNGNIGSISGDENPTCETTSNNPISWIMCPIFNMLVDLGDWLFRVVIQPFLSVSPITTNSNNTVYQIWASFRIFGNIVLIFLLLFIVFGQAIGGGVVDAYTAKKALPRILIGAILVNISIYIIAILVDITNVLGNGVGQLITSPLKASGNFTFSPTGVSLAAGGVFAVFLAGGGIWATFVARGIIAGPGGVGTILMALGLFIVLPAVLIGIAIFATLIIRQGLIMFLTFISPITFALFALPATEKFFKKWWEQLSKALLMYPIVTALFAIADVMSVTIREANNSNAVVETVAELISFIVLFVPLAMIPFSFKLAGGLLGTLVSAISTNGKKFTELVKGDARDPNSRRNRLKKDVKNARLRGQYRSLKSIDDKTMAIGDDGQPLTTGQKLRRRAMRFRRDLTATGYSEYAQSVMNKEEAERIALTQGYGPDDTIRHAWAYKGDDGRYYNYHDGKEVSEASVMAARRNVMSNSSAFQEALSYEMTKADRDGTYGKLMQRYADMATEQGWAIEDTNGMWKGAGFKNKGTRLEGKHRGLEIGPDGRTRFKDINLGSLSTEFAKIKSYDHAGLSSSTFGVVQDDMESMMAGAGGLGEGEYGPPVPLELGDDDLDRARNYYHGLTNLERGYTTGEPGEDTGAPPMGTRIGGGSAFSTGGGGIASEKARQALVVAKRLAELDPRVKELPDDAGSHEARDYR